MSKRGLDEPAGILIVDDDFDVRTSIAEALEDEGYAAFLAESGQHALDMLRTGLRPSLILLDLMMPVMDGETFCRVWREDPGLFEIPVVVISADAMADDKARGCQATALLKKPVQLSHLLEVAERYGHRQASASE